MTITRRASRLGNNETQRLAQYYARQLLDGMDKISKHSDRVYAAYNPDDDQVWMYARRGSKTRTLPHLTDIAHLNGSDALLDVLSGLGVAYDPGIEDVLDAFS